MTATATVRVRSLIRPIRIVGWARAEMKINGAGALNVEVSEDRARVSVSMAPSGEEGLLELFVPAGSQLHVTSIRGPLGVSEITGALRLATVDADVTVKGSPKHVEAESVSGRVDLDLATCDVRASSVSASVRVQCHDKVSRVWVKTVSGPIAVKGTSFERLELRSVSGAVDADGKISGDGPFELRSHSGSVSLDVPKGTPLVVDARTRGRVDVKPAASDAGASSAPTVTLRSFSGDVRVDEK